MQDDIRKWAEKYADESEYGNDTRYGYRRALLDLAPLVEAAREVAPLLAAMEPFMTNKRLATALAAALRDLKVPGVEMPHTRREVDNEP